MSGDNEKIYADLGRKDAQLGEGVERTAYVVLKSPLGRHEFHRGRDLAARGRYVDAVAWAEPAEDQMPSHGFSASISPMVCRTLKACSYTLVTKPETFSGVSASMA